MSILFRKIRENDLEKILKWRTSLEVTAYMYTDPLLTMKEQKKWYEKIKTDETRRDWVINVEGEDVGLISLTNIDNIHKRCNWAYYIASTTMRGKGIGKSVELNIYHFVFESLNLNKLCCEVFSFNEKVITLHQKYGSMIEGVRREHIYKNGSYYDIVEMAILKKDWLNNIKDKFEFQRGKFEE